jgi:hypothetical protein
VGIAGLIIFGAGLILGSAIRDSVSLAFGTKNRASL